MSDSGSPTSFTQKLLQIQFALGEGTFGTTGANVTTLSGLRASATITRAGGPSLGTLSLRVYGMKQAMMNQLSTLGSVVTSLRQNQVAVLAGTPDGVFVQVFHGTIFDGYGDYGNQPDVPFVVNAQEIYLKNLIPSNSLSLQKSFDVATVLSGLANQLGLTFEGNGVQVTLPPSYFPGPPLIQARKIIEHAGLEWNGGEGGVLAVWKPGQSRDGDIPLISKDVGMIGYPSFFSLGIQVRTLFNPTIGIGRKFKIQSELPAANQEWVVASLSHTLETLMPKGKWESTIQGTPPQQGPVVPSKAL